MTRAMIRLLMLSAVAIVPVATAQVTWYVDDDAAHDPGPGDPTVSDEMEDGSPAHPFDAIQKAVDAASAGDEIIVLDGVYTGAGNKRVWQKAGVAIRSLHGPDHCVIELEGVGPAFYFVQLESTASIDGFTIQNGDVGIISTYSDPVIHRCIIRGNARRNREGAGFQGFDSSPLITDCAIEGNTTLNEAGAGLAIRTRSTSPLTIRNCVISGNTAGSAGGGLSITGDGDVVLENCIIADNVAVGEGGGALCEPEGSVTIHGCTIARNRVMSGPYDDMPSAGGLVVSRDSSEPHSISDCIFWGNTAMFQPQIDVRNSPLERVVYCLIEDGNQPLGPAFANIIRGDPMFADPNARDYHLAAGSPCINAGDQNAGPAPGTEDIDGQPRVFEGRIDIGADERYPFVDCNGNGMPDTQDLADGASDDCNGDGIPDECGFEDCNGNGVLDACDIAAGSSLDCDGDGVPDECQRDCDGNGRPDACDLADGSSSDDNHNGVPDECEYTPVTRFVDDDASADPCPGDPNCGDPLEDGSAAHPFDAIQEAIDAAYSGDEIVVRDGLYTGFGNYEISLRGKLVYLHSEHGPEQSVIDCEGRGAGFLLTLYETNESRIEGLTIRGGWSEYNAGGIDCRNSSPTIHNCIITQNESVYYGAITLAHSDAVISNCRITDNDGSISGYGAIALDASSPLIANCLMTGNRATWHGGVGCYHGSDPMIINCTITGNSAEYFSGGVYCSDSSPIVRNSILDHNTAPTKLEVYLSGRSHPSVRYCALGADLPAGVLDQRHNLRLDPRFLDSQLGELADRSPCIDAGDPNFAPAPGETDVNGDERLRGSRIDIGAVEYDREDCNGNGVADSEDIASGASPDCDSDGVPDECQVGGLSDCDENGVPDLCDIHSGAASDCNDNGIPDACEPGGDDCDGDGVPDMCEILAGSLDINGNGVPDECEPRVTVYVDDDAPNDPAPGDPNASDPAEDGTAAHPFDTIQEGLDSAPAGDAEIVTVQVAPGLYTGVGNRELDFAGKALALSGAGGPEQCVIDCQQRGYGFYFHSGETEASVVENLTIRNGLAEWAAGIHCLNSAPTIRRCILTNNEATGGLGGAIYLGGRLRGPLVVRDCIITENRARYGGAGIGVRAGHIEVFNCLIAGNVCASSSARGVGVLVEQWGIGGIHNCLIVGNASEPETDAAAVFLGGNMLTVTNCTIVGNLAESESDGISNNSDGNTVVRNSIIFANSPAEAQLSVPAGTMAVANCDVQGGLPPEAIDVGGNTSADPRFVDPVGPDATAGTWQDNDYRLLPDSPCIDAGDNTAIAQDLADLDDDHDVTERTPLDLARRPRFVQYPFAPDTGVADPPRYRDIADIGAYEFQFCFGDLDQGGDVDVADLTRVLTNFGQTTSAMYADGDLDGDGDVDITDLGELLSRYGDACN